MRKIWGSTKLEPWFPDTAPGHETGEVWFADGDASVLIKFLFTTENLSVQVHPNDEQARATENSRGKTEMWHILRAEPGAKIALGLERPASLQEIREASLNGSIMQMLRWIPVRPGDTYFVPAGAIHAIGAGIALCEIQEHSDITYRLFDYGRDRELHLDQGLAVTNPDFQARKAPAHDSEPVFRLVECPFFTVDSVHLTGALDLIPVAGKTNVLIANEGQGHVEGAPFRMGEVWTAPDAVHLTGEAKLLHVSY